MRLISLALGLWALHFARATTVTCGSVLKLKNWATSHRLHSHQVNYGTGSGQQSVTGYSGENNDVGDYWEIFPALGETCASGAPMKNGQMLRLFHTKTRMWLHSHLIPSPISAQQEVSCYGSEASSDTGDHWVLEVASGSKDNEYWMRDGIVRFRHADTGNYLGNHNKQFPRPIAGQTEVFAGKLRANVKDFQWSATEGVYFDPSSAHSESGHAGIKREGEEGHGAEL